MNAEFLDLIKSVMAKHPGPWRQRDGYSDRGAPYTSLVDARGDDLFDGESGRMSEPLFDLLLNFPEMVEELYAANEQQAEAKA